MIRKRRNLLTRKPMKRRGSAKRRASGAVWVASCQVVWDTRGRRCEKCGRYIKDPRRHNFHHRKKRSAGGDDTPENTALLCFTCHSGEHRIPEHNGVWID